MIIQEQFKDALALGAALMVLLIFSAWHPTGDFASSPSYWADEAVSVEKARNFLAYGALDIAVAPDVLSGKPYASAAAGPLLTLPLAGFFSLFGIGVAQVRFYMLLWLTLLAVVAYVFMRKISGRRAALLSLLLVVTFSPLYANGKTATGDIPGFVALLFALYYLYMRRWYVFSGMLFGITVTTKPSLYLPVVGIALLELFISESHMRIRRAAHVFIGALVVLVPWLFSLAPLPFEMSSWQEVYAFFQNPFPANAPRVFDMVGMGDMQFLLHTTVLYYVVFGAVVFIAVWFTRRGEEVWVRFLRFSALYVLVAFFLYMRSPGWLRYLLAGELLLFLACALAVHVISHQREWRYRLPSWAGTAVLMLLIAMQMTHFVFFSWRTASQAVVQKAEMIRSVLRPGETVGIINDIATASLIDSGRKFQVVRISGNTVLGKSPLAYAPDLLPDYIVVSPSRFNRDTEEEFVLPYEGVLEKYYRDATPSGARFAMYKKTF